MDDTSGFYNNSFPLFPHNQLAQDHYFFQGGNAISSSPACETPHHPACMPSSLSHTFVDAACWLHVRERLESKMSHTTSVRVSTMVRSTANDQLLAAVAWPAFRDFAALICSTAGCSHC